MVLPPHEHDNNQHLFPGGADSDHHSASSSSNNDNNLTTQELFEQQLQQLQQQQQQQQQQFSAAAAAAAQQQQQFDNMSFPSAMTMMNPYQQQYPMRASPTQQQQQHLQNLMMTHGQVVQPPMQSILPQPPQQQQQQFMMPPPPPPQQQQFGSSSSGIGTTEASSETLFAPFSFVGTGGGSNSASGGDAPAASREALLTAMQQQQHHLGRSSSQQQQDFTSQQQQQQQQSSNSSSAYSEMLPFGYGGGPAQQQRRGSLGDSSFATLGFGGSSSSVAGGAMDPAQSQLGMLGAGASFVNNDPYQQASSSQQYQDQFRRLQQQHFQQMEQQQIQQQQQSLSGLGQMINNGTFFNQAQQQQQQQRQQQQYDSTQQHLFQQMLQTPLPAERRRSSLGSTASDMSPLNPALHGTSQSPQRRASPTSTTAGTTATNTGTTATAAAAGGGGGGFASLDSSYLPMQQQQMRPTNATFQATNEYHPNFPQANEPSMLSSFLGVGQPHGLVPFHGGVAGGGGEDTMLRQLPRHLRSTEKGGSGKKKAKGFPEKLMEAMVMYGEEDVVAWLPDGKSFVVVKPDEFVARVLNPVFKQAKYSSFVRKLHRWGFVRLTSGTGTDCFHHPFFNRNRRELASKITVAAASSARHTAGATSRSSEKNIPSLSGVDRFAHIKKAAAAAFAHKAVQERVNELEQEEKMGRESGGDVDKKPSPELDPTAKSAKGSASPQSSGIGMGTMASSLGPSDAAAAKSDKQSQFEQGSTSSKGASSSFHTERAEI